MSHRIPGSICLTKVGSRWIDDGTLCRSRSTPPGPLRPVSPRHPASYDINYSSPHLPGPFRMLASLILAATPDGTEGTVDPQTMIKIDIGEIQKTPFGRSETGQAIVRILKHLNNHKKIKFEETDDRGGFLLGEITVNKDFYNNLWKSMCTLVHEASHAVWDANHPAKKGKPEKHEDLVEDEVIAETNELEMYKWSKTKFHGVTDAELEKRLEKLQDNKLRAAIEEWMDAGTVSH